MKGGRGVANGLVWHLKRSVLRTLPAPHYELGDRTKCALMSGEQNGCSCRTKRHMVAWQTTLVFFEAQLTGEFQGLPLLPPQISLLIHYPH